MHKIAINLLGNSVLHQPPTPPPSSLHMLCKGVSVCVREGADQCNINVSISSKLSSSSREKSIAVPVNMTFSYSIWSLHWSLSLLLVIIYIKYRLNHLYPPSTGVMSESMSYEVSMCMCMCIFLLGFNTFLMNTNNLLHHPDMLPELL